MRPLLAIAAAASLVTAVGCASSPSGDAPPFYRPGVTLRDVRPNGVGITGGSAELVLTVVNPNVYDVHAGRFTYRVTVDDVTLGTGAYDADVAVAAHDSATVRLPLSFSYLALGRAGRSLMGTGAVTYRVAGHIRVGTPHGTYKSPFDRTGNFSTLSAALKR